MAQLQSTPTAARQAAGWRARVWHAVSGRPHWERRMVHGTDGVPMGCLVVADVDLETGQVRVHEPLTPPDEPWQGVHVTGWLHGHPLGERNLLGDPDELLGRAVEVLRDELAYDVLHHRLTDALLQPHGLAVAAVRGLDAVPHPAPPERGSRVTVAICTRNRAQDLRTCLEGLRVLDEQPFEVLVIDNASDDDAARAVAEGFPGVRVVTEPRAGLDWARNRALAEMRGDVLAFVDDDVLVDPGWLSALHAALDSEPGAGAVTGLVRPAELSTRAQTLFELVGGFGRGYYRTCFNVDLAAGHVAARVYGGTGDAGTGANMAFRREVLQAVGGFDTALDVGTPTGGGGDLEAFFRVVGNGYPLVYAPEVSVRHRHRRTMAELERQMVGHGTGSYSYWLGAGAEHEGVQRRAFRRLALSYALRHHLGGHVRALLVPELVPPVLIARETQGMLRVWRQRLYAKAQEQARQQDALHGGPPAPTLVRPVRRPAREPGPDPEVHLDLSAPDPVHEAVAKHADLLSPGATSRVRLTVSRDGAPVLTHTLWCGGGGMSAPRLAAELVGVLGPALVEPGLSTEAVEALADGRPVVRPRATHAVPPVEGRSAALAALLAPRQWAGSRLPADVPVSVLMCTRGRPAQLQRALASLRSQRTDRPVQLVVVDNSLDPTTTSALLHDDEVLVHEPRPGLSRARNAGLPALSGEVVVFVDDDVIAPPTWLEALLSPFTDPAVDLVTGNVLAAGLAGRDAQLFEDYGGLGRGPHRRLYDRTWLQGSICAAPTWELGATANAAVRRDVLTRLGPFVESLGAGTPAGVGEDTELFYRVLRSGGQVLYEPTAVVLHEHRADRAALRSQLHAYSAGHVAYHLHLAERFQDRRGVRRLVLTIPKHHARGALTMLRWPAHAAPDVWAAQVLGHVTGPVAFLRARRAARQPHR